VFLPSVAFGLYVLVSGIVPDAHAAAGRFAAIVFILCGLIPLPPWIWYAWSGLRVVDGVQRPDRPGIGMAIACTPLVLFVGGWIVFRLFDFG